MPAATNMKSSHVQSITARACQGSTPFLLGTVVRLEQHPCGIWWQIQLPERIT
jgi:hypothetical protein